MKQAVLTWPCLTEDCNYGNFFTICRTLTFQLGSFKLQNHLLNARTKISHNSNCIIAEKAIAYDS